MDYIKIIDQILNQLGQIDIRGWDNIQKLVSANILLTNLKEDLSKSACAASTIATVKEGE